MAAQRTGRKILARRSAAGGVVQSVCQAADRSGDHMGGFAMGQFEKLTDRGKSKWDIVAAVFAMMALTALASWFLTPGK
jgi:hypothetical protein